MFPILFYRLVIFPFRAFMMIMVLFMTPLKLSFMVIIISFFIFTFCVMIFLPFLLPLSVINLGFSEISFIMFQVILRLNAKMITIIIVTCLRFKMRFMVLVSRFPMLMVKMRFVIFLTISIFMILFLVASMFLFMVVVLIPVSVCIMTFLCLFSFVFVLVFGIVP